MWAERTLQLYLPSLISALTASVTERPVHPSMCFLSHAWRTRSRSHSNTRTSFLTCPLPCSYTHSHTTHSFTNSSTPSLCHISASSFLWLRMYLLTCGFPYFSAIGSFRQFHQSLIHPPHSLTHYSLTHTLSLSNPDTFAHALINDLTPSTMQSLTKQQHPVSFCAKPSRGLVGRGVKDAKLVFCREERKRRYE